MYKIFADNTLIYDGTVEDYKIGKGIGTLETNKAGSFSFSVYPEHFFYDHFVKKKTVIKVTKSDRIFFRGRVLDEKEGMWKCREIVCEGELNFLQDSLIRPYRFNGTPREAFVKFVTEHNAQVDEFKRFQIGRVTVYDPNNYIARSNSNYENALKNLTSRLLEDSLGGYLHITHGEDGKDPVPTLHYLADFSDISDQNIEFGRNLKDYLKKSTGQAIATAIIPLGAKIDDKNSDTEDPRLTIADVNNGLDYVYDAAAVAQHGWIFDTVIYDDVTLPENLKERGLSELSRRIRENITVELTAVDLHLLDRSIESFRYDTYVRVISPPHSFAETLLCHRQTFNILKPDNDTVTLGTSYSSFTGTVAKAASAASAVTDVQKDVAHLSRKTSQYRIAEQRLTSLMAQSFGVFKTEEVLPDGSTVYYMHDKPTLAASENIWKMTGDAFAVSSDGGHTWNAGLDMSGNAVLNILSVIGIDATWINADNLSAISANLGGWKISENAIYTEYRDSDLGYIYRLWIRPPDSVASTGLDLKPFVEIQRSTDGGSTFQECVRMNESGVYFADRRSGGVQIGALNYDLLRLYDEATGRKVEFDTTLGVARIAGMTLNVDQLYAYGKIYAEDLGDTNAYSGEITLGGISMTFLGGILKSAYYSG